MPRRIGFHVCTCLRENNYSTHLKALRARCAGSFDSWGSSTM